MLLRSSSTPILNSWIPPNYNSSKDSSPSLDHNTQHELNLPKLHRTKSLSHEDRHHRNHSKPASRTLSETLHWDTPPLLETTSSTPLQRLFSSSGLDEEVEMEGGGGCEDGGGKGGSNSNSNSNSSSNSSNNYHGHESMEAYYKKMIEVNPGNALLLGNYAMFLKRECGDVAKAEEYCGRSILANPNDASMLSMYAELIWVTQRDAHRAETYFDQAVKSAPNDCYVLASYAKFLWDMEE